MWKLLLCLALASCSTKAADAPAAPAPEKGQASLGAAKQPAPPIAPTRQAEPPASVFAGNMKAQLDRVAAEELERAGRLRNAPPPAKAEQRDNEIMEHYTMLGPSPVELLAFAERADRTDVPFERFKDFVGLP